MIKKISFIILLCFSIFSLNLNFEFSKANGNCYSKNASLSNSLDNCFKNTDLVQADNLKVDGKGFKEKIIDWRDRIAFFIGIFAVFGLVFSGFTLVTSAGDDEKINKAKSIFKWTIFGVLAVMFAASIITLLVNIFYSIK